MPAMAPDRLCTVQRYQSVDIYRLKMIVRIGTEVMGTEVKGGCSDVGFWSGKHARLSVACETKRGYFRRPAAKRKHLTARRPQSQAVCRD